MFTFSMQTSLDLCVSWAIRFKRWRQAVTFMWKKRICGAWMDARYFSLFCYIFFVTFVTLKCIFEGHWADKRAADNLCMLASDVIRVWILRSSQQHRLRSRVRQYRLPVQPDALRHRNHYRPRVHHCRHLGSEGRQKRRSQGSSFFQITIYFVLIEFLSLF